MDDPILVELEEDDYWYRGYNMRTGERGIFPAFYAHEVVGQARDSIGRSLQGLWGVLGDVGVLVRRLLVLSRHAGLKRNPCWVERFNVQFLGSVEVPYHQGNGILCAAMQKVSPRVGDSGSGMIPGSPHWRDLSLMAPACTPRLPPLGS